MFFKKLKVGKIYTLVSKTTKVKYKTMLTSIVEIPEKMFYIIFLEFQV